MQLSWNGQYGKWAKNYRAGGARGEVAREASIGGVRSFAKTSSRPRTGTMASVNVCVATAEPAVEQSWQGCELAGPEFRSAQKWNPAARKIIPNSSAQKRSLLGLRDISVLRRSLGWNGCGVKQRVGMAVNFRHLAAGMRVQRSGAGARVMCQPGLGTEDRVKPALCLLEVEIEAHLDLDVLPVSTVQIDNRGYTVWLAKRA